MYVALRKCLRAALDSAVRDGVVINHIIHKVRVDKESKFILRVIGKPCITGSLAGGLHIRILQLSME